MNLDKFLNDQFIAPFAANSSLLDIRGNGTSVDVRGLGIDNDTQLIALHNDYLSFNLSNLVIDMDLGYEFISTPAIVADLGFLNFTLDHFSLFFDLTTAWQGENVTLKVSNVNATIDYFDLQLDNVNDFLYVTIKFIDSWLASTAQRIIAVVEEDIEQLMPLLNRIFDLISNHIPIPGTSMYLDLGFSDNFECREQSYLTLPLSLFLQSTAVPHFNDTYEADFLNITNTSKFEIEGALSQYLINNILYEVHANGPIVIDTGDLLGSILTVGWAQTVLGSDWTGFDADAPCKMVLVSQDPYPHMDVVNSTGGAFTSHFYFEMSCKQHNVTEEPY